MPRLTDHQWLQTVRRISSRRLPGTYFLKAGFVLAVSAAMAGTWLDVPFVRQESHGCGAACISMLMQYWDRGGAAADPRLIFESLYSPDVKGIRGSAAERYLRAQGFRTFVFQGDWTDLEQHLSKGRPLMVCLESSRRGPLHYVIVAGVDNQRGIVRANDPAGRKLAEIDRGSFEKDWKAANNWTLLALPLPAR
jgi:ABC-type bacteriocin/lantibiotic exporter with double-glycine peptidase domain